MKIAVIQLTSILDYRENLKKIDGFIKEAKSNGANKIFLPEVFFSMSDGEGATPHLVEDGNHLQESIVKLARENEVFLIGGSVAFKSGDEVLNRAYVISPEGEILSSYDKMNLFSCHIIKDGEETILDEGNVYTGGSRPQVYRLDDWTIGLSICFDLRFPELYRHYFSKGVNLITVPAAFTVPTGRAHWETLLRARAIENQSYVVAANQYGVHNEKISTWGHSLVISPWGEVLANGEEGEKVIYANLSLDEVSRVKMRMNVPVDKQFLK